MLFRALLVDEQPRQDPDDTQHTDYDKRHPPAERKKERRNQNRSDDRTHRSGSAEDTLRQSPFFLREPFGVGFRRSGPRAGFAQTEQNTEERQRFKPRRQRGQRIGATPQQSRQGETLAGSDFVIDLSRDELAHAIGDHEKHGNDGQHILCLTLLFLARQRRVDEPQIFGDTAVPHILQPTVSDRSLRSRHDFRRTVALERPRIGLFVERAIGKCHALFRIGHPHVVERAAVQIVDDGHERDERQHDPS